MRFSPLFTVDKISNDVGCHNKIKAAKKNGKYALVSLLLTQENTQLTMTISLSVTWSRKQPKWSGSHPTTQGKTNPFFGWETPWKHFYGIIWEFSPNGELKLGWYNLHHLKEAQQTRKMWGRWNLSIWNIVMSYVLTFNIIGPRYTPRMRSKSAHYHDFTRPWQWDVSFITVLTF